MIQYCLWDVGGTLYPFSLEPLEQLIQGRYTISFRDLLCGKESFDLFCGHITQTLPYISPVQINTALHQCCGSLYPASIQAMQLLKQAGIRNGILSNALPNLADTISLPEIDKACIFTSYDLKCAKPNARIFHLVKERLNCQFSDILLVDNTQKNIEAARNLGMHGILFNPHTIIREIDSYLQEAPMQLESLLTDTDEIAEKSFLKTGRIPQAWKLSEEIEQERWAKLHLKLPLPRTQTNRFHQILKQQHLTQCQRALSNLQMTQMAFAASEKNPERTKLLNHVVRNLEKIVGNQHTR